VATNDPKVQFVQYQHTIVRILQKLIMMIT